LRKEVDERYQTIRELESDLKKLRQRFEFQTELERSMGPESRLGDSRLRPPDAEAPGARPIPDKPASGEVKLSSSAPAATQTRASNAEYILSEIKRHKIITALSLLAVVLITVVFAAVWSARKRATLTDKDTVLLTNFINATGDPVFDGTLRQALAVQLGQSPFLNILSEDRVREALRFMGRSPDEPVTRDVGREICQRLGLKALLVSSIASLGSHYVITLEAINAQTGDAIAREQAEAENKEQVLRKLGESAVKLRETLGESLQSIQKFDAPIEQGTTSSLEAFKAFSLGVELQLKGKYREAIPLFKRATEIDPNFALAYGRMASMYYTNRQYELAAAASQKAFELRDRVSERERLYISAGHYDNVTGEVERYLETLELWKRTYPRDASPPNNLAVKYNELGLFDKALAEAREAIRLNPNSASGYSLAAAALVGLNRFDEARQVIGQAQAQKLETTAMRRTLYRIAFVQGDAATMQYQIEWLKGKPDDYLIQGWQSETAAFSGQLQKSRDFSRGAFDLAQRRDLNDVAAQIAVAGAGRDALFGACGQVKDETAKALGITNRQTTMANAANVLAACGEFSEEQRIVGELTRRSPTDTVLNRILLPLAQARIHFHQGDPNLALKLLEATSPYEGYALFQIAYLRGQSYLNQQKPAEAAAEFQRILDHRGSQPTSPIYPLAHLGLGRSAALSGDPVKARRAYEDFFGLWKDADPEIPILQAARREYEKLK
jgi:eukaryotic-like serine/threonine-protein kinase